MNAPAKGLLKVVSILFIIFGAIATIVSLLGVFGSAVLSSVVGAIGGVLLLIMIVALLSSVLHLVLGIIGVGKRSADPSKAGFYIVSGIILVVLGLISLILGFTSDAGTSWSSYVGFVLPILYIIGGFMNKKAAVAQ